MISFEEAYKITLNKAYPIETERVNLMDSLNRILAEEIHSDIDMPPFNKSAVDGFACKREDLLIVAKDENSVSLEIIETIPAGKVPERSIYAGQCSRIMTGAMVPEGADCIIMVEETQVTPDGRMKFTGTKTAPNICYKAEDIKKGERVLEKGTLIKPQHIAVLASVGAVNPLVSGKVKVGILSTGDELVEPGEQPSVSKIRNSNAWQLMAQVSRAGGNPCYHGIALDNKESLTLKLEEAMKENQVVILTGGVSMGDFDYVPEVMINLGIEILFKSIAIQPGRPTVFGKTAEKFIFGLPGNPVSSFVLFELLVKPFLLKMMGGNTVETIIPLRMGVDYSRKKSMRKSLIPVIIRNGDVHPLEYHGSAHINAFVEADAVLEMEIGETEIRKGEVVHVRQV